MSQNVARTEQEIVLVGARGQSQYRGVTRHHQQGRWEARIGRVHGNKYMYLGTFNRCPAASLCSVMIFC